LASEYIYNVEYRVKLSNSCRVGKWVHL
jgi:hypothetical protein